MTAEYDAVVVGAGPAGSAAAFHLARAGRRVLLVDRWRFPRDKSCGDGLTRASVTALQEMGVLDSLPEAYAVRGTRLWMRGRGYRDFVSERPGAAYVIPRLQLDEQICNAAIGAGATFWPLTNVRDLIIESGVITGVRAVRERESVTVMAPFVIAADGATSHLARLAGMYAPQAAGRGFAIRAYFDGLRDMRDLFEVYSPITDVTDRFLLPSYGWVFPISSTAANIGIGLFESVPETSVRQLFDAFVAELHREPRFSRMRLDSPVRGAPLRCDFVPEQLCRPGLMLVGDAAGLISPFTGEGISHALESGRIAASVVDTNLRTGRVGDTSDFRALMESRFTGYFEAGRRSAHRYRLAWHVLDGTFQNDGPFWDLWRRTLLVPGLQDELQQDAAVDDVRGLLRDLDGSRLEEQLMSVAEILMSAMRAELPFVAALFGRSENGEFKVPFRPALLSLLAASFGAVDDERLVELAAATELAYVAELAQYSVEDDTFRHVPESAYDINWGNRFSLLVSDLLLSKARQLVTTSRPSANVLFANAMLRACEGQALRLANGWQAEDVVAAHGQVLEMMWGTIFELPCRLGAEVARASAAETEALAAYGRHLGVAFRLADEARDFLGVERIDACGRLMLSELRFGGGTDPLFRALEPDAPDASRLKELLPRCIADKDVQREIVDLLRRGPWAEQTMAAARLQALAARDELTRLPASAARDSLARLATYSFTRDLGTAAAAAV